METKLLIRLAATPPETIRLLPLGKIVLGDGREPFMVTEESMAKIMAAWEQRGNEMVIDYEHQTVAGGEAPAAGWVKSLHAAADGLWAQVAWTDRE
jgi:phage I-like protein